MAGPLKRTGYRSSPEEEALYRQYHDSALAGLHQGRTPEEVVQELLSRGVAPQTAKRIAWAVNHEFTQAASKPGPPSRYLRWAIVTGAVFLLCTFGAIGWFMIREGERMSNLVKAIPLVVIISGVAAARVLRRRF
jgi:hypothetical protein